MHEDLTLTAAAIHVFPRILLYDGGRYLVATLMMAAIVWWMRRTRLVSRVLQQRRATAADVRREVLASCQSLLVYGVVATLFLWASRNGYTLAGPLRLHAPAWEIAAHVAVMLVAHDTWFYWTHRAMHDRRLFHAFHRLHHRSVTPTPFAAYAFAWPEAVVQALFVSAWGAVVPAPAGVFFIFMAVQIIRNVMGHAGIELHPAGWADHPVLGLFNTTTHHDLHHAGGFDTNYGLYFTWWDRWMGTEHPEYRARFRTATARPASAAEERPQAHDGVLDLPR